MKRTLDSFKRTQKNARILRSFVKNACPALDKTMWTLLENFKGFSQVLKEQSSEKGTWVCLQTQ